MIAFAEGASAQAAKDAGAVEGGGEELVTKVEGGLTDFDVAIAHPALMRLVGKLGRVLGPQGKMPSPKSGTVTERIGDAVRDFAAGMIEFRNDEFGNVHARVGRADFETEKLVENIQAFMKHVTDMRPASVKGDYIESVTVARTMGPGVRVQFT